MISHEPHLLGDQAHSWAITKNCAACCNELWPNSIFCWLNKILASSMNTLWMKQCILIYLNPANMWIEPLTSYIDKIKHCFVHMTVKYLLFPNHADTGFELNVATMFREPIHKKCAVIGCLFWYDVQSCDCELSTAKASVPHSQRELVGTRWSRREKYRSKVWWTFSTHKTFTFHVGIVGQILRNLWFHLLLQTKLIWRVRHTNRKTQWRFENLFETCICRFKKRLSAGWRHERYVRTFSAYNSETMPFVMTYGWPDVSVRTWATKSDNYKCLRNNAFDVVMMIVEKWVYGNINAIIHRFQQQGRRPQLTCTRLEEKSELL